MEILFYLLITTWIIVVTHFIYVFVKSDMDFDLTIEAYKNILNKFRKIKNKELVNEEKTIEIRPISKEDIENNIKELEEIKINKTKDLSIDKETNLNKPNGFPIDLTLTKDLSEEEKIVRDRVLKKIKTEPTFFYEGGRKKMVLPLEAILFLNRGYNPLVNENGEIIISIKEQKIMEELKEIIMSLKSNGEVIYKSDEEIISSMKVLIDLSRHFEKPIEELGKIFIEKLTDKINNDPNLNLQSENVDQKTVSKVEPIITQQNNEKQKIILEEPEISEEELLALSGGKLNKEEIKIESKSELPKKEKIQETKSEIKVNEVKKESSVNEMGLTEEEMNAMLNPVSVPQEENFSLASPEDLLLAEMNSFKSEVKEVKTTVIDSNDKNIKGFLQSVKWSSGNNVSMDWKNIESCIMNILSDNHNYTSFLRNIIKQQPLVFNDSKTVVFIEIQIIYVAFAKLFGIDYDTIVGKFKKMPARIFNEFKEGMAKAFGDHVSDLITSEKNISVNYFYEGNTFYRGTGIWLELDVFKMCLTDEEFDFFRSYPYNDKIKLGTKNGNSIPLINDIESTEI